MKKMTMLYFGILAIVSCIVSVGTFFTGGLAKYHWGEIFHGGKVTTPSVTVFFASYGYIFPLICCICSIIYIIISTKKYDNLPKLWQSYSVIVISELLFLVLFALIMLFPSLKIMYRL